jgi:uncharacterized membrane protein YeaQ/YmgE (transglycosylase-associated protein family)
MSTAGWIILGLIAGFIASKLVNDGAMESFCTSSSALSVRSWAVGCFRCVRGSNLHSMIGAAIGPLWCWRSITPLSGEGDNLTGRLQSCFIDLTSRIPIVLQIFRLERRGEAPSPSGSLGVANLNVTDMSGAWHLSRPYSTSTLLFNDECLLGFPRRRSPQPPDSNRRNFSSGSER